MDPLFGLLLLDKKQEHRSPPRRKNPPPSPQQVAEVALWIASVMVLVCLYEVYDVAQTMSGWYACFAAAIALSTAGIFLWYCVRQRSLLIFVPLIMALPFAAVFVLGLGHGLILFMYSFLAGILYSVAFVPPDPPKS